MKILSLLVILGLGTALDATAGTVTYTNQAGKTATSRDRAPGSFQRTNTFPNGSSSTYNGNFQGQGNGNYTGTIDRTLKTIRSMAIGSGTAIPLLILAL